MSGRVLVVDDDEDVCAFVATALRSQKFTVHAATNADEAMGIAGTFALDLVITDVNLGASDGLTLCRRVLASQPDVPVVVITAYATLEAAVGALRAGAYDFLTKPLDVDHLGLVAKRAVEHRQLRAEVHALRETVARRQAPSELIGDSDAMRKVEDLIDRVATTDATVLILGESGTGKELVARAIHARGGRCKGPFVAINCAAVPPQLLESELFGHVKGAFTDAKSQRMGLFVEADGGTLFLDEIGEMPAEMQAKLLRALQERTVRPVGGNQEVPFDARVIAATNRDLEFEVHEKRFREDLYYRVAVVQVHVPPLRERHGDVVLLAQHFVLRFADRHKKQVRGLSEGAVSKLRSYGWPGNVRELENCIESAVALTRFDHLAVDDLPERVRAWEGERLVIAPEGVADLVTLEELTRRYIDRVLALVGGNKSQAARILGIDRRTLHRRFESEKPSANEGS